MKFQLGLAALALAAVAPVAQAQGNDNGSWLVRGRALSLSSANGGATNPDLKLSINDKTFPEVDFSYFFSPNVAAELVLTYPQKQDLRSDGTKIGSFKHLPPTLLGQYHFTGQKAFRPYVGAGVNYTLLSDTNLPAGVTVKKNSTGLAFQVGVDFPLGGGWLVNLDLKKVQIKTDVSVGGTKIGDLKVDPTLFSVGVGYRF